MPRKGPKAEWFMKKRFGDTRVDNDGDNEQAVTRSLFTPDLPSQL